MKQVDFDSTKIQGTILRQALPMLAAQIVNLLYNIVDRIYIARIPGSGTAALGAVGVVFPAIILTAAFTNLYGGGAAPLFAIELGRKRKEEAGAIMASAFFLLTVTSLALMAAGFLFGRMILEGFGASEEAMTYSLPYLRIYLTGTFFSMAATGMNPFINAQGFPGIGMLAVISGAGLNMVLDPVFIFLLGLGVRGAAAATVISQAVSCLFVLRFLFRDRRIIRLRLMKPDEIRKSGRRFADIVSLGVSSFVMQFTNSMVTAAANNMLGRSGGDLYISIMTITASVRQILDVPCLALSDGASPVISYNYGARRGKMVRQAILFTTLMSVSYTATVWAVLSLSPLLFIRIFSSDPSLYKPAARAMHIYFFAFVFQALQYSGQTAFKALNKKKRAIFFSLLRKAVIVIPLTLILPGITLNGRVLGTDGVFLAEPVSNVIGGTACFVTMLLTVLPEMKRLDA